MGGNCCTLGNEDLRPRLKVFVSRASGLPLLDDKSEIEAYVQLRFGPLKGNRNDTTHNTTVNKTLHRKCKWNETIYIPVAAIHSRYSLEVAVWDKDSIGDADDLCGKAIIHHIGHRDNNAKYFLPSKAGIDKEYDLEITTRDGHHAGNVELTCRFVASKNSNMDEYKSITDGE